MTCPNCIEKENKPVNWRDFIFAVPVAMILIALFIYLQKIGLINLINASKVSYGTAFLIGLIASVSSCMAVVGGLVLSMSASFAQGGNKIRPQILFHVGRLVSFFLLGGVIGILGSTFQLGGTGTFILSFLVAIVLLILGLNLLDIFPWAKKLQPTMPNFIGKHLQGIKGLNHILTPFLVGFITFFLPCGFTQSMQLYALSTGSFWTGALIMLTFSLGTLPVLAILSFSSLSIKKTQSGMFFKTVGLIVIFFGIFNLISSFSLIGINLSDIYKVEKQNISTTTAINNVSSNVSLVNGVQIINLEAKGGYLPRGSVAKAGLPTTIRFTTNNAFDCSRSVRISSLNINKMLPQTGTTDVDIGTPSAGLFRGTCGMGMYPFEVDFK